MTDETMLSAEQAVLRLRADPGQSQLIRDAYWDEDVLEAAGRFQASAEFQEALGLLGGVRDADILDLGSGRGISAHAFAKSGARCVYAVEPDDSGEIGRKAIQALAGELPIRILDGYGEQIPLDTASVDVVYGRQVFHHARDLELMVSECARVARDGASLLICREHVVDDQRQLEKFLEKHPIHGLTGEEHAHSLERYLSALTTAGFEPSSVLGQWDSVINAFPAVRSWEELSRYPTTLLEQKFGPPGKRLAALPGAQRLVWARLGRRLPGRMYSFLAQRIPRGRS